MEFIVSRNALLRALKHVRCAITKQGGWAENRTFHCFVFSFPDTEGGSSAATMKVHASNGDLWMTESVLLDKPLAEPQPFAIYYSDILKPVKSLDEQPLRFEVLEYQVIVHHSLGTFRLPLENCAKEFLQYKCPAPDASARDGWMLEYEAPCLKSILKRCAFAMAQDELRPVMNGVYFNLTDNFSDYVSSEGHKLVRVRKSPVCCCGTATTTSFILPYHVVKALLKVLPNTGDATLEYQKELKKKKTGRNSRGQEEEYLVTERRPQCRITIDDTLTLSFNTVEGIYPSYWSVIPEHHEFKMTVDRVALIKSCDRLGLFADVSNKIEMNINNTALKLKTEDLDFSVAGDEMLPCVCSVLSGSHADIRLRIGMNAENLSQTLKALSTEKVTLLFLDHSRAVLIQPQPQPDNEEITMLLMPMLCND